MGLSLDPSPKSSMAGIDSPDVTFLSREDTQKQLDSYYGLVKRQILRYQSPTTGLFPVLSSEKHIASVRDSVYCAASVWGLYQSYRRIDDDRGKSYELGQSCVFCMRGILACWMRETSKLEAWKSQQSPDQALHSIFSLHTGEEVESTAEYNHMQLDCVSLYLLYLVQMISSGLEIIYSVEEVSLVQNLVYYVERAYRTPDFGPWGRGTKYNDGNPEVNASCIGMAKAALEAVNGFNLYGSNNASYSVIYADIDAHNRNRSIFETLLPRESNSKNTDVSLLTTISFPAFATHDDAIYERTKNRMIRELEGNYGFRRFLGDGYGSEVEDTKRRFYKKGETLEFENVENEWPIFYIFMIIDGCYKDNQEQVNEYQEKLSKVIMYDCNGDPMVPQMFYVPHRLVVEEKQARSSVKRKASNAVTLGAPGPIYLMGQAVYILSGLLTGQLLALWELDPIRRYLPCYNRPRPYSRYSSFLAGTASQELVVQIVMIAESTRLQAMLANYGIQTQTPTEVEPVQIWPAGELVKVLKSMGQNSRIGLNGRPERPIGSLGTSKLYRVGGKTVLCYPIIFSGPDFYLSHDMALLTTDIRSELQFIGQCWRLLGRPTFCILISEDTMRDPQFNEMLRFLAELKQGHCGEVKVRLGRLQNLLSSSCVEHLDFYHEDGESVEVQPLKERKNLYAGYQSLTDIPQLPEIREELVDMAAQYRHHPTHEILGVIATCKHFYGQIQLCGILLEREGPDFSWNDMSVRTRLEGLCEEACRIRYWAAMRYSSSLLDKVVDSLSPFATQILVNGKFLTIGTIGVDSQEFQRPMSPHEIHQALFQKVRPYNIIAAVLLQEMILYCGKLIATNPELFRGILVLRMAWILRALELYKSFVRPNDTCPMENLPPSKVRDLLHEVLRETAIDGKHHETELTDFQRKELLGCLIRVPDNFYPCVWQILQRCSGGLRFREEHLPQLPTIKMYDARELSFYHIVEKHISQYLEPAHRNLVTRLLAILSTILKRNPEIYYKATLSVEELISDAVEIFCKDEKDVPFKDKMDRFNRLSCSSCDSYLGRAIINKLLAGEIDEEGEHCKLQ